MADARRSNERLVPAPGEELCVAFTGTRHWRGSEPATETLNGFKDLVTWCKEARAIDARGAAELDAWASRHGGESACLFDEAIAAREAIYTLLSTAAAGGPVAERDVEALDRLLAAAPARTTLAAGKDRILWRLPPTATAAASLLAPVLWSAGDLLAGPKLQRLRMCANEKCRWLFIDDSKSGTRRWCSMSSCGNRAKAHRHYMRKTGAAADAAST